MTEGKRTGRALRILRSLDEAKAVEAIAYQLWVGSLNKKGFPKNNNGTSMDCWQLYDYFKKSKSIRNSYLRHAFKK